MTAPATERVRARKLAPLEAVVREVVRETPDTVTVWLDAGAADHDYLPGQFVTIDPHQFAELERWVAFLEQRKGREEPARAYSLASSPHERLLAVTIKEEAYRRDAMDYPPLLSPLLVRGLEPGRRVVVQGFAGRYALPADIEDRTDHIVHVCAGSGVVPNWSMLKWALRHDLRVRHTLVYGNRTWDDVIYREGLRRLAAAHPTRLRILHALSRDPQAAARQPGAVAGRVDATLLAEAIGDPSSAVVFACGPAVCKHERRRAEQRGAEPRPRFMETVIAAVRELGVARDRLFTESYG